jgi:subtilisin family serine protease/uncharacterized membrane protein
MIMAGRMYCQPEMVSNYFFSSMELILRIYKCRLAILGAVIAASSTLASAERVRTSHFEQDRNGRDVAAGEVIVKFKPGASRIKRGEIEAAYDIDGSEEVGEGRALRFHSRTRSAVSLADSLSRDPGVEYAEPNYRLVALLTPNEPAVQFASQWGMNNTGQKINASIGTAGADIGALNAWSLTTGSRSNVFALLDSGTDYNHVDLAANIWSAPVDYTVTINGTPVTCLAGSHGFNVINMTCDPMDDFGHGTQTASAIGAVGNNSIGIVGTNWVASIIPVKMLDATGNGTVADAVNAIEYVIQTRHALGINANVRVLSNSYGGMQDSSTALSDAIARANQEEMLFVAAAGNSYTNNDIAPNYPASYGLPNVISVAATTNRDALPAFSNYGPLTVHLGAPGQDIITTTRNNGYAYATGTSLSAPFVAGTVGLMLARDGSLTVDAMRNGVLNTVDVTPSLSGNVLSNGRLNAFNAVSSVPLSSAPNFRLDYVSQGVDRITAGQSTSFVIHLSGVNGFSDTTSFTVEGFAGGITATFSPASLVGDGSTTMTLSTNAATAVPGTYVLTVKATSGALVHTTTVSLTVDPAASDYAVSSTLATQSTVAGGSVNIPITLTDVNGFPGTISLSALGLPAGATVSFNPANVASNGTSTATISTSATTPAGSYPLTIYGASGNVTHSTVVDIVVTPAPDFALASTTPTATVVQGTAVNFSLSVTALNGFTSATSLSVAGLPAGTSAVIAPSSVAAGGSATLTVTSSGTTPVGTYVLTVTGVSGTNTHTASVSLIVVAGAAPGYSIATTPVALTITRGKSATSTVTESTTGGFAGTVALTAAGLPTGVTATFSPSSLTATKKSSTLTLKTKTTSPVGSYTVTVSGKSGTTTKTATIQVTLK